MCQNRGRSQTKITGIKGVVLIVDVLLGVLGTLFIAVAVSVVGLMVYMLIDKD